MLRHPFKNQQITVSAVIPMKIGIQLVQAVPDTDFRRYDGMA